MVDCCEKTLSQPSLRKLSDLKTAEKQERVDRSTLGTKRGYEDDEHLLRDGQDSGMSLHIWRKKPPHPTPTPTPHSPAFYSPLFLRGPPLPMEVHSAHMNGR